MTHYFKFSMPSIHILNARKELEKMIDVKDFMIDSYNYYEEHNRVFINNVEHGVLVIYSINAALESIIVILNKELNINKKNFWDITKSLKKRKVITDLDSYKKCLKLREYRNEITHWDKNESKLLGTCSYLPYMFESDKMKINSIKEELISVLTKEKLNEFSEAFNNFIINIKESDLVNKKYNLVYMLDRIMEGSILYEG